MEEDKARVLLITVGFTLLVFLIIGLFMLQYVLVLSGGCSDIKTIKGNCYLYDRIPDATVEFEQKNSVSENSQDIVVTLKDSPNLDFMIIKEDDGKNKVTINRVGKIQEKYQFTQNLSDHIYWKNDTKYGTLFSNGEVAVIHNVSKGDNVRVHGFVDGHDEIIASYKVGEHKSSKVSRANYYKKPIWELSPNRWISQYNKRT